MKQPPKKNPKKKGLQTLPVRKGDPKPTYKPIPPSKKGDVGRKTW